MKFDFPRACKSEEPTLEKLVGAIELSDQDLAGVVGASGGDGERYKHHERYKYHERYKHHERYKKHGRYKQHEK